MKQRKDRLLRVFTVSRKSFCLAGLLMLVTALFPQRAFAEDTGMTVDEVASRLLEEEAKYSDLKLKYVLNSFVHMPDESAVSEVIRAEYMEKKTGGQRLRYLDCKISRIDPQTKEATVIGDKLVSFNGNVTMSLYRLTEEEPMHGIISAGYDANKFHLNYIDPPTRIRSLTLRPMGEVLRENADTFNIESQSEVVDGISAIKLAGTIMDGFFTVKLWVSPERSFLPIKMQIFRTSDGKLASEMVLSNLVKLPDGSWFPKSIRSGPPGEYAHIHEISEISIEPIPKEPFTFDFPPNTHVFDDILKTSYTTY